MSVTWRIYCATEAAHKYAASDVAPITCPTDPSHTVVASGACVWRGVVHPGHYFGDGRDGDVVISTNTELSRDMYYRRLTITSGATLLTGGFRIFVQHLLDIQAGCKVGRDGVLSVNFNGSIGGGPAGGVGGAVGAPGGTGGSVPGNTRMGGTGGAGGPGNAPSAGGIPGFGSTSSAGRGGIWSFNTPDTALTGRDYSTFQMWGGNGGGGGGGGTTGAGGTGGAGGCVVIIAAKYIQMAAGGSISSNGGDGLNGSGGGGRGGGGGGGCVVVISTSDMSGMTITATGGAGATPGGPGQVFLHQV